MSQDIEATPRVSAEQAIIGVISALGFVGNMHYCPSCLNHFHEDCGQHKPDCYVLAAMLDDGEWWDDALVDIKRRIERFS